MVAPHCGGRKTLPSPSSRYGYATKNKVESGRANYGQVYAAVNCNIYNYTGTCEGLAFFTFPKDDERYAHFIEFARYVTSSILQSDNVSPACSVAVV